jgi:hypothetical protein
MLFFKSADYYFIFFTIFAAQSFSAQMAKLVDALVSGTSVSDDVQVRVLFWALAPRYKVCGLRFAVDK